MFLNPNYSFKQYSDYIRQQIDDLCDYDTETFTVIQDLLQEVTYRNASFTEVYNDNANNYKKFKRESFHFGGVARIAHPAYFHSRTGKEYQFDISVEIWGALVGKTNDGEDMVRLTCKMNVYKRKVGFDY